MTTIIGYVGFLTLLLASTLAIYFGLLKAEIV